MYIFFGLIVTLVMNLIENSSKCCSSANLMSCLIQAITLCTSKPNMASTRKKKGSINWFEIVISFLSVIMLSLYTAKILTVLAAKDQLIKTPDDLLNHGYTISTYSTIHIDRMFQVIFCIFFSYKTVVGVALVF